MDKEETKTYFIQDVESGLITFIDAKSEKEAMEIAKERIKMREKCPEKKKCKQYEKESYICNLGFYKRCRHYKKAKAKNIKRRKM